MITQWKNDICTFYLFSTDYLRKKIENIFTVLQLNYRNTFGSLREFEIAVETLDLQSPVPPAISLPPSLSRYCHSNFIPITSRCTITIAPCNNSMWCRRCFRIKIYKILRVIEYQNIYCVNWKLHGTWNQDPSPQ